MIVRRRKIEIVIVSAHDRVHVRRKENEIEKDLGVETGKLLKNCLPSLYLINFFSEIEADPLEGIEKMQF